MANFNLNDYETVEERLRRFKADYPDSRITTQLIEAVGNPGSTRWTVQAFIWKTGDNRSNEHDRPDATGLAMELDGVGMANKTSALENCETSAIGRALANLNYTGNKRATREEMEKVQREESRQQRKEWLAEQAKKLLETEKTGNRTAIEHVMQWAREKQDRQLYDMAQQTLERMPQVTPDQAQDNVQEVLEGEVVEG